MAGAQAKAATERPGYIQPHALEELWFHTGTTCNLSCPFCLEGSKPGDNRINPITFDDAKPFMDEALTLGIEQFSFTGGEPFLQGLELEELCRQLLRQN